jgi:hypothetical protein
VAALASPYLPLRPTETVLYGIVRENLESFLAYAREHYDGGLPRYVEAELRAYLKCGVFSEGFIRARCDECGHDLLIAFSCKARTACPSCTGRRMANTAATIVDRVLPEVPVRQYVLSLPYELRKLAAFKADVLTALGRIFVEEIFTSYRARAKRGGVEGAQCGAINFVQRFGSLNLNVHFHVAAVDGVFTRGPTAGILFHPAAAPTNDELEAIVRRTRDRSLAWLRRREHLDDRPIDERSDEPPAQTAIDACAAIAMGRGQVTTLQNADAPGVPDEDHEQAPGKTAVAVERDGFNVHADVRIEAGDDRGRERLMRYGARPPLSLERLRRLPGGRVAYRLKYVSRGRGKHRIMSGTEFMARLSAIIAPPRYPLVRYAGVLGPRSSWRKDVVPRPRECPRPVRDEATAAAPCGHSPRAAPETTSGEAPSTPAPTPRRTTETAAPAPTPKPDQAAAMAILAPVATGPGDAVPLAPNVLSVRHWERLMGGALYAATSRVDWARLLRRTFDVDVLQCPRCHGRLRVLAVITEREPVERILAHLGLPTDAPTLARARDPTDDADAVEPQGQLGLGFA